MSAILYLVGVGPGDPELLTLKAARILAEVDIVAFPQKPGARSYSLTIAKSHIPPKTQLLALELPMLVDPAPAQKAYDQLASELKIHLDGGRRIAYLCEGDPLFYGSAMYLISRMGQTGGGSGHNVIVIPGITSLSASAAAILRPLCARNQTLKVLPAPLDDQTLRAAFLESENIAIIKVGRHLARIKMLLKESGHLSHAVLVSHASSPEQTTIALDEFNASEAPYFSTILCTKWGE